MQETMSVIIPSAIAKFEVPKLKYDELTFGTFFIKFKNCISLENLKLKLSDFVRSFIAVNKLFDNFTSQFLIFDLFIKNFNLNYILKNKNLNCFNLYLLIHFFWFYLLFFNFIIIKISLYDQIQAPELVSAKTILI